MKSSIADDLIRSLRDSGLTHAAIGQQIGLSPSGVRRRLRVMGKPRAIPNWRKSEFSAEQDEVIRQMYPTLASSDDIIAAVNALQGATMRDRAHLSMRARVLKVSRPTGWQHYVQTLRQNWPAPKEAPRKRPVARTKLDVPIPQQSVPQVAERKPIRIEGWRLMNLGFQLGIPVDDRTIETVSRAMRREDPKHPGFVLASTPRWTTVVGREGF